MGRRTQFFAVLANDSHLLRREEEEFTLMRNSSEAVAA